MKYLILIVFCLSIHTVNTVPSPKNRKYLPFQINQTNLASLSVQIYQSSITGNKKTLPQQVKRVFKRYGLMHLLTPSGLHFSSLFFFNYLPNLVSLTLLVLCFYYLQGFQTYQAMERVILFKILNHLKSFNLHKINIEIVFVLTLLLSVLLGNFAQNPMSFFYSILFWGTILLFRHKGWKMFLYTNLSLHLSAALFGQEVSFLSLFINPLFTAIFVFAFPTLILNYFIGGWSILNFVINKFFIVYFKSLSFINQLDIFPTVQFNLILLVFVALLFYKKNYRWGMFVLCLHTTQLNKSVYSHFNDQVIINLGHPAEVLTQKKKVHFIDQSCQFNQRKILCTKKPSNLGGPVF